MTRRDTLLASLERAVQERPPALTESGNLRIQTMFGVPRRTNSIYPLAHAGESDPLGTWQEHILITAGWEPHGGSERLFYALELYVYTLPAQSAALVYVSKLDSTGFGPAIVSRSIRTHLGNKWRDSPSLISTLTAASIEYFCSRRHWEFAVEHVSLHIFARSQAAYLFPASPKNKCKRVLSDTGLIRWWRSCVTEAILMTRASRIDAYYTVPGLALLDSHPLVPLPSDRIATAGWRYGHPYGADENNDRPPLPLHPNSSEKRNSNGSWFPQKQTVATTVPVFPDDPKGRFVSELANQAHGPGVALPTRSAHADRSALMERHVLERTSIDAYWEALGFRQECSSGNIAGVFIVGFTGESSGERVTPKAKKYALPYPMLDELVLERIQQDKCDWSGDDAIPHTQQFYDAVDRALRRKGGAGNDDSGTHAAEGVLWTRFALCAIDPDAHAAAQKCASNDYASRSGNTSCVNTLTVKRRRKN